MEKPASGIILADKPEGMTSQALVSRVKRMLQVRSAGHTGTLDPIATGLNLICYGRATKVCEYITGCDKEYVAALRLGVETDTGDVTGAVVNTCEKNFRSSEVAAALPRFLGTQGQIPPMYSAIKRGGKKLYELARAGETVELEPRQITIYALELLDGDEPNQEFTLRIACSKGTYIRSLCRDIGRALGSFGTMAALRRTAVGGFSVRQALTPETLAERLAQCDYGFVLPMDAVFAPLGSMTVDARGEALLKNGAEIPADCVTASAGAAGRRRIYNATGAFLAVGTLDGSQIAVEKRFFEP